MSHLSRSASQFQESWQIASTRDEIESVLREIMLILEKGGYDETSIFAVRLSLEEGLSNAMNHGNGNDSARSIELEISWDEESFLAVIEDEGSGYDPGSVPDPTADENLTVASGRGLALIRAFMTEVTVIAPGNRLQLRYTRPR